MFEFVWVPLVWWLSSDRNINTHFKEKGYFKRTSKGAPPILFYTRIGVKLSFLMLNKVENPGFSILLITIRAGHIVLVLTLFV